MKETFPIDTKVMTFIVTRDREKAKGFYGSILGFRSTGEDSFAVTFDLNGVTLRIGTVEKFSPQAHTVLGWQVPDIEASVKSLEAKGVKFTRYDGMGQDALGIWSAPGSNARVAWFLDSDGNNLSITQF